MLSPQLESDKLALPVNPSPLSPIPSPNQKPPDATILTIEPSPSEKNKGFFVDESEPLLRCDSTSSGSSALSRTGSFITKGTKMGPLSCSLEVILRTVCKAGCASLCHPKEYCCIQQSYSRRGRNCTGRVMAVQCGKNKGSSGIERHLFDFTID